MSFISELNRKTAENRKKMNAAVFFSSPTFRHYIADAAEAILAVTFKKVKKKNPPRLRISLIHDEASHVTAYTDSDRKIVVNTQNSFAVTTKDIKVKFEISLGLLVHEIAHILFLDGPGWSGFLFGYLNLGNIPVLDVSGYDMDIQDAYEGFKKTSKNKAIRSFLFKQLKYIENIINDAVDELLISSFVTGYYIRCLQVVDDIHMEMVETIPDAVEIVQHELSNAANNPNFSFEDLQIMEANFQIGIVMDQWMLYAKYGIIKDEDYVGPILWKLKELISLTDRYRGNNNTNELIQYCILVMLHLWDYYQVFIEAFAKKYPDQNTQQQTLDDMGLSGSSIEQEDNNLSSDPLIDEDSLNDEDVQELIQNILQNYPQLESGDKDGDSSEEDNDECNLTSSGSPEKENPSDELGLSNLENKEAEDAQGNPDGDILDGQEHPFPSDVFHETGHTGMSDDQKERLDNDISNELEKLMQLAARTNALEQMEDEKLQKLYEEAQLISLKEDEAMKLHKDYRYHITRQISIEDTDIEKYNMIVESNNLLAVSKSISKRILDDMEMRQMNSRIAGQYFGRLDRKRLYRIQEGNCFYRNQLPGELNMAIAVMMDESGSMSSDARIEYIKRMAIVVDQFCTDLQIPCLMYGHTNGDSSVPVYLYRDFETMDGNDKYRLTRMTPRLGSRDGFLIWYGVQKLLKRSEQTKILFVISDGRPNDTNYNGQDMAAILKKGRQFGVHIIGAAIGDDKPRIEAFYGKERFLDISDLERLPMNIINLLNNYIQL